MPADQETILHQLHQHMTTLPRGPWPWWVLPLPPAPLKVRRHGEDGTVTEVMEPAPVAVEPLYTTLKAAVVAQTPALVAATTLRQVQCLRRDVQVEFECPASRSRPGPG